MQNESHEKKQNLAAKRDKSEHRIYLGKNKNTSQNKTRRRMISSGMNERRNEKMAKRMLYRVKSWRTEEGATVYSVFSCADDVEHRRHRRNPFDIKYVQAVLSTFESISVGDNHGFISRSQVEAASANVHVRMELIKTMKENLARNTSEALKHYKGSWRIKSQIDSAVNVGEESLEKSASRKSWDLECGKDSFYCHDIYEFYLTTFGSYFENSRGKTKQYGNLTPENGNDRILSEEDHIPVNLHTAIPTLESEAKENPNFLLDEDLCFNLDKEATETLENLIRFGSTGTSISEVNFDGDADIKSFKKKIKTVTKELILNADLSDTEEELQDANLNPQADQLPTCTSISDKDVDYIVDIDEVTTLNAREQSILMGELTTKEKDNSTSQKHIEKEDIFDSSLMRVPCLGLEVRMNEPANHSKDFGFTDQTEQQNISEGIRQDDRIDWSNAKTKISEDVDSIEEFEDYETANNTLEINESAVNEFDYNIFTESSSVIETIDSFGNYMLGLEDSSNFGQSQDNLPSETIGIHINLKDLVKFHYAKVKQSQKKGQWLVQDWEKLLHVTEHFENNSDIDCISDSLLNKIVVCPKMFADSLSKSSMNLVEHRKQLQGSCFKIPGVLSFALKDGGQDFGLAELDEDVNDNGICFLNEVSHPIHDQKQSKLSSEDSAKHDPTMRNLCSEAHMFGAHWDDILCPSREIFSKKDRKPKLLVTANVCSVAKNGDMLPQSNRIADIPFSDSQEPKDCFMSRKHVFEKFHMKFSQEHFPVQMCDVYNFPSQVKVPINFGQNDKNFKEVADLHEDCLERCLEVEDATKDVFNQKTKYSKASTDIHIKCGSIEHSGEHSTDQHDTYSLDQGIGNTKEIFSDINEAQIASENVGGMSALSSSFITARMEDQIDGKDHNRQKQRKRYRLDDLIADVVMAECQFHQKDLIHFDLAPLSSSLATGIYSFYNQECITSIHFKQLLEASKGDGMITVQRYYMALLSLAHQQNIGVFKGPVIGGYQIHLQASSGCSLNDIIIHLEPLLTRQNS